MGRGQPAAQTPIPERLLLTSPYHLSNDTAGFFFISTALAWQHLVSRKRLCESLLPNPPVPVQLPRLTHSSETAQVEEDSDNSCCRTRQMAPTADGINLLRASSYILPLRIELLTKVMTSGQGCDLLCQEQNSSCM